MTGNTQNAAPKITTTVSILSLSPYLHALSLSQSSCPWTTSHTLSIEWRSLSVHLSPRSVPSNAANSSFVATASLRS